MAIDLGEGVLHRRRVGQIVFDDGAFPMVQVIFEGSVSDEEFEVYLNQLQSCLTRGLPYAVLLDATRAARYSASQRRMQAQWQDANRETLRSHCRGVAFVITNRAVRGILTAILWLSPMPMPHQVVSNRKEALTWLQERLSTLRPDS